MHGLDSNVVLRLLLADDLRQHDKAREFLSLRSSGDPAFVSWIVLCEVAWVLSRGQRYPREQIAEVIEGLLSAPEIRVEREDSVAIAVEVFRASTADLSDLLIAMTNTLSGCSDTFTFDQGAAATGYMTLIR